MYVPVKQIPTLELVDRTPGYSTGMIPVCTYDLRLVPVLYRSSPTVRRTTRS